jgi:hypothetical protein
LLYPQLINIKIKSLKISLKPKKKSKKAQKINLETIHGQFAIIFKFLFVDIDVIRVVDDKVAIAVEKVVLKNSFLEIKQVFVDLLEAKVLLNELSLSDKFMLKASLLDIKTIASNRDTETNNTDLGLDLDLAVVDLLIEVKIEIKKIKINFITLTELKAILEIKQHTTKLKLNSNIQIRSTKIIFPKLTKSPDNKKISGVNLKNVPFLRNLLSIVNVQFSLILKNVVLQNHLFTVELKQVTFDINTLETIQISIDINRLSTKTIYIPKIFSTKKEESKFQDSDESDMAGNAHRIYSKETSTDESESDDGFMETLNMVLFVPTARISATFDLSKMWIESSLLFSIIDIRIKPLVELMDQIVKEYVHDSKDSENTHGSDIDTIISTDENMNREDIIKSHDIDKESHESDTFDSNNNVVFNGNLIIDFEELKISTEQDGFETLLQVLGGYSVMTLNSSLSKRGDHSVFDNILIGGGIKEFNLLVLHQTGLEETELNKVIFTTMGIKLFKKPRELIEISTSPINIDFSLSIFYILVKSFQNIFITLSKYTKKSIPTLPLKKLDFESDNIDIDLEDFPVVKDVKFVLKVPVINLEFLLPENTKTLTKFTKPVFQFNQRMFMFTDLVQIYIYKPEKTLLLQLSDIESIFEKKDEMDIRIDTDKVNIQVPYAYGLYNVVENLLNYIKGSKKVYRETFKIPLETKFDSGRTFCEAITIPSLKFRSKVLKLTVDDDIFEGILI